MSDVTCREIEERLPWFLHGSLQPRRAGRAVGPSRAAARGAAGRSRPPARRARCSPATPRRRRSWTTLSGSRSTLRTDSSAPPSSSTWRTARSAGRSSSWSEPTELGGAAGPVRRPRSRARPGSAPSRRLRRPDRRADGAGRSALAAVLVATSGLSVWLAMRARTAGSGGPGRPRRAPAGGLAHPRRRGRRRCGGAHRSPGRDDAAAGHRSRRGVRRGARAPGRAGGRAAAMAGHRPHAGRRRRLRAPAAGRCAARRARSASSSRDGSEPSWARIALYRVVVAP